MTVVADNYAKVLMDMNIAPEKVDDMRALLTNEMVYEALANPFVSRPNKHSVIEKLFPEAVWNFVKVMSDNGDIVLAEDMFQTYDQLALDAKKPVVYCGDLNVAHNEIDLKNPGPNRGSAGFSDQERAKMTQLLDAGCVDTFRFQHPDATGAYSWWSYRFNARKNNAGWRIDYFIVSRRVMDKVKTAAIHPEVFGSDHCPVELDIEL